MEYIPKSYQLGTGGKKSPLDLRDITTSQVGLAMPYPESYFTDISMLPVQYQGKKPSCVAYSGALIKQWLDYKETGEIRDYSKRFLYALAKKNDQIPEIDGTYPRVAWDQLRKIGICDGSFVEDDITLERNEYQTPEISQGALDNAEPRQIKSYVAVNPINFDSLKSEIYSNGLVAVLMNIGDNFWTNEKGENTWDGSQLFPLRQFDNFVSGHEVVAYGYDKDFIYFRNHWSDKWGCNGNGFFDSSYMKNIREAHVFMDLPDDLIKNLKAQYALLQKVVSLYQLLINLKRK